MSWLFMILLPQTYSFSTDSKSDGEVYGFITLSVVLFILLSSLVLSFLFSHRRPRVAGVTQLVLLLQYIRWAVIFDYSSPSFYKGYWSQLSHFFHPYQLTEIGDSSPDNKRLLTIHVETTNFIDNSQEYLIMWGFMLMFSCIVKITGKDGHYKVLAWGFLISYFDMVIYSVLHLTGISDENFVVSILAIVSLGCYTLMALIIIFVLVRSSSPTGFIKLFSKEFNKFKFYYPYLFLSRGSVAVIYALDLSFQYVLVVVTESFLVFYLLVSLPYKNLTLTVISTLVHTLQVLIVSIPIIYEDEGLGDTFVTNMMLGLVSFSISLCFIRFLFDLFSKKKQKKSVAHLSKAASVVDNTLLFENDMNRVEEHKEDSSEIGNEMDYPSEDIIEEEKNSEDLQVSKKPQIVKQKKSSQNANALPKRIAKNSSMFNKLAGAALGIQVEDNKK